MVNDPYSILGISQGASDDEVKRAYRDMSRKYHPDSYIDNPLAGLAEEKFKEVQDAYDQIMKDRQGGGYSSARSYSGSAQSSSQQDTPEMQTIYNDLNNRNYTEALNRLSRISNRTSRWFYCSAIANAGIGNNIEAMNHARQASNMEPNNPEYTNLVNQLQWNGKRYQTNSYGGGGGRPRYSTGNFCCDLWCADSCCECMGGDLCSCM